MVIKNKLSKETSLHRNSNANMDPHHLYEIVDKETDDTYKYGISWEQIDSDGLSNRVRTQVAQLNRITDYTRFFGRILIRDISGKKTARGIETEHIKEYELKHGCKPKGNPVYSCKK